MLTTQVAPEPPRFWASPRRCRFHLAVACFTTKLLNDVADLADTGCANGMPFRFQSSAGVDGEASIEGGAAFGGEGSTFAFCDEAEVLTGYNFGDGKAIVQFGKVDVFGAESGHRVSLCASRLHGGKHGDVALAIESKVIGRFAQLPVHAQREK